MTGPAPTRAGPSLRRRAAALAELGLAAVCVVADLFLPTILLILLAGASLRVRRERPESLGLVRGGLTKQLAGRVLLLTVAWTGVQVAVLLPVLEHLTGRRQDVSGFAQLEGNLELLLVLLAVSWTLAAFGEELAYRGYVLGRALEACGPGRAGVVVAITASAVLFGLAHTEQGVVGVAATTCDAIFFSVLRLHSSGGLWAPFLAHGMSNTIGLTTYFLVGPVYGLW